MGRSNVEASLLVADDLETRATSGMSRVNEDYVALSGLPANGSQLEYSPLQRRRRVVLVTCCIAATLLLLGAAVSCNLRWESQRGGLRGGEQQEDDAAEETHEHDNEFYAASRTGYHFQPEKNWMSDPNAPFFYKGFYHFFYQYNPGGVGLADIHWGHAVSTDLIHWEFLELALGPDAWYDVDGVLSGSATIREDGIPTIMYTGNRYTQSNNDWEHQTQNLAVPVDPSDPLLRKWKKIDANPIIEHPEGIKAGDFRDPSTAWLQEDGLWRFIVGALRNNADGTRDGVALLYKSDDFIHWEIEKDLRKGIDTGMWECLELYPVWVQGQRGQNHSVLPADTYEDGGQYVLKAAVQDRNQDHYCIGTYSTETDTFTIDDPSLDIGYGSYRYDFGKIYASRSFHDTNTGRHIVWSWSPESDTAEDQAIKGWASVQAIPRVIYLDGKIPTNLLQWPVEELEALRGAKTSHRDIKLDPTDVVKVAGGDGSNQLDIIVVFERPDVSTVDGVPEAEDFDCTQKGSADRGVFGPFGLLIHADDELVEHTGVFFYVAFMRTGQWTTFACTDRSRSSLASDLEVTNYGNSVPLLAEENKLSLRILLDHSILETFVQGGRICITCRVYPTVGIGSRTRLFLFNNGSTTVNVKTVDVYQMNSVNITTFALEN